MTADTRLATYGTLSPGRENHGQLAGLAGRWRRGTVRGWLDRAGWAAPLGYPGLVLDPDGPLVDVHLFESAALPEHWARLDEFEGADYRRVVARVRTTEGDDVDAWIYVLAAGDARDGDGARAARSGDPSPTVSEIPELHAATNIGHAGTVVSLNRSPGGVPKLPIAEARISASGMEGDRQRNLKYHGGPDRALSLYSAERIEALRAEGHPIAPGTTGENVTIAGLDWSRIVPGVRLRLGEVVVEATSFADPCRTIRGSFVGGRSGRIGQKNWPGWSRVYARVIEEGVVRVGDRVEVEGW